MAIFTFQVYGYTDNRFVVTPFVDLSYDLGGEYREDLPTMEYWNWTMDGVNLSWGMNLYRYPLYLQLQTANFIQGLINKQNIYGIARIGLIGELVENGFVEMNLSYTDDLTRNNDYSAYSGSIGYYHIFTTTESSRLIPVSWGINFGSILKNYQSYQTPMDVFTVMEVAWHTEHFKPYLALGLNRASDLNSGPAKYSPFLSIGFQAQFAGTAPFHSGNQIKLTYYKRKEQVNAHVWKPNIYLYPESRIQAKVVLSPKKKNKITASIPNYNEGWNVSVEPSGMIDGKYEYLFYEGEVSSADKYEQFRFGWSVSHSELWQFLPKKMEEYGFNEKEIKDFVEYWKTHLPKSPFYDIIPLTTQEVEKEFALNIDPKPDAVMRVWFYIIPTDKTKNLQAPKIIKFQRKGFTVTEWGVILGK
jgi:hypothetical protein